MTRNPAHPLRTAREAAGRSQDEFARAIGLKDGAVLSNIERGRRKLTTGVARRAEIELEAPTNSLVRYAEDLPANLLARIRANPGLLSCLTLTPRQDPFVPLRSVYVA